MNQAIVSLLWLNDHLSDPNLVIVDCRFTLGKSTEGYSQYLEGHIPGALYFHLEHDLSGKKSSHGGRHPLPDVDALTQLFANAGIDDQVTVVAYDDQEMAMASRLWWLLRYLGHERVAVLDGGLSAWRQAGLPITDEISTPTPRKFVSHVQHEMLVSIDQVRERGEQTALLDSRAGERYRGEQETIDPKAGHIPGALHYFYKENLTADGMLLDATALQKRFSPLEGHNEVIVYCGSGVTACVNLLSLHQAGRSDAKLYLGSWSDWSSFDLPVATGPTPTGEKLE